MVRFQLTTHNHHFIEVDMNENMVIWDAVRRPPESALKKISGGRLNGMTDISPLWRIEALTREFGPCGKGWWYTVEKLWLEPASNEQISAFAMINLFIKDHDHPIPGVGGSAFVTKEKSGLYTSDECYKMAITDALGVAAKALGVAADIYAGKWDGSKYQIEPPPPFTDEQKTEYDRLIMSGDAFSMFAFLQTLTPETRTDLHNSFPAGQKVKMKAQANDLESKGGVILQEYIQSINEALDKDDDVSAKQLAGELIGLQKRAVANALGKETANKFAALVKKESGDN